MNKETQDALNDLKRELEMQGYDLSKLSDDELVGRFKKMLNRRPENKSRKSKKPDKFQMKPIEEMSQKEISEAIISLFRYERWQHKMRRNFEVFLTGNPLKVEDFHVFKDPFVSYWYASLFVVLEGWRHMRICDKEVNYLISSKFEHFINLLRRYRNVTFHFQVKYFDKRFTQLFNDTKEIDGMDFVVWVIRLSNAFENFFIESLKFSSWDQ